MIAFQGVSVSLLRPGLERAGVSPTPTAASLATLVDHHGRVFTRGATAVLGIGDESL